jgi:hypothetical protein
MATQFARLWVLKSDESFASGETVKVLLKSGRAKEVVIDLCLGKSGDKYLYSPKQRCEEPE